MEKWKTIDNYPSYEISDLGRVRKIGGKRSHHNAGDNECLVPCLTGSGYYCVRLRLGDKIKTEMVHRLVAAAFVPCPDPRLVIDHINGSKTDNRASNLRYITQSDNIKKSSAGETGRRLSRRVLCLDTGEIYPSCRQCALQNGGLQSSLSLAIKHQHKFRGREYTYID